MNLEENHILGELRGVVPEQPSSGDRQSRHEHHGLGYAEDWRTSSCHQRYNFVILFSTALLKKTSFHKEENILKIGFGFGRRNSFDHRLVIGFNFQNFFVDFKAFYLNFCVYSLSFLKKYEGKSQNS